jgi:hypothetical protein
MGTFVLAMALTGSARSSAPADLANLLVSPQMRHRKRITDPAGFHSPFCRFFVDPEHTGRRGKRQTEDGRDHGSNQVRRQRPQRERVGDSLAEVEAGEQRGVGCDADPDVAESVSHGQSLPGVPKLAALNEPKLHEQTLIDHHERPLMLIKAIEWR